MRAPKWAVGMRRIGPGMYVDRNDGLHISENEICQKLNVPYTSHNSRIIELAVEEVLREQFGANIPATVIKETE